MSSANEFGRRLAVLRRGRGMSQETLAEQAGLSRNYIGLLESGRRQPSLHTTLQLQRALGVELRDLVAGAPPTRTIQEEKPVYGASKFPPEYERLLQRLQKCSPGELAAIHRIVDAFLKYGRKSTAGKTR